MIPINTNADLENNPVDVETDIFTGQEHIDLFPQILAGSLGTVGMVS